jgi:hypothetical protein
MPVGRPWRLQRLDLETRMGRKVGRGAGVGALDLLSSAHSVWALGLDSSRGREEPHSEFLGLGERTCMNDLNMCEFENDKWENMPFLDVMGVSFAFISLHLTPLTFPRFILPTLNPANV